MKTVNRAEFGDFIRKHDLCGEAFRSIPTECSDFSVMQFVRGPSNTLMAQAIYNKGASVRYEIQEGK